MPVTVLDAENMIENKTEICIRGTYILISGDRQ